jgi:hypothetical protein
LMGKGTHFCLKHTYQDCHFRTQSNLIFFVVLESPDLFTMATGSITSSRPFPFLCVCLFSKPSQRNSQQNTTPKGICTLFTFQRRFIQSRLLAKRIHLQLSRLNRFLLHRNHLALQHSKCRTSPLVTFQSCECM